VNEVEANLTGDDAVVSKLIHLYGPRFASHGLEFVGVVLKKTVLSEQAFPSFHFQSQRTGLQVEISFSSATKDLNGGFLVWIIKPVERLLNLEDYLKLHGREELTKMFAYRDPATDVRNFADSFLQMLCTLFDNDLKAILDGTTFEETPIDWMGYK